jgi:hypothetical protein
MKITHLHNTDIDRELWDNCIARAYNQLPCAYSWYLDVVSPKWEALVTDDYEYVMPLPFKKKYKVPYLVQPVLTQQLGIFSKQKIDENIVEDFIKEIPYYSYELNFNERNFNANANECPNFVLNLNKPYEDILLHYSKNTVRNIEKAKKLNLTIVKNLSADEFDSFYYAVEKNYFTVAKTLLNKLINKGIHENAIKLYGVYSSEKKLIAALCLLHSTNRLTYLLPVSNAEGKASSAMFLLIDKLISENAEKEMSFDFEGSRIEGIARFYKGFGAKYQPYYTLKRFRPSFLIGK